MNVFLLQHRHEFQIHRNISDFYYMQKRTELAFLIGDESDSLTDGRELLIEDIYITTFSQWKKDARWLNHFLLFEQDLHGPNSY